MASYTPCGAVIDGYKAGHYVYKINDNQLMLSKDNSIPDWMLNSGKADVEILDRTNIRSIQKSGEQMHGPDVAQAVWNGLIFGAVATYLTAEATKGTIYTYTILLESGRKLLVSVNDRAYQNIQKILFEISDKIESDKLTIHIDRNDIEPTIKKIEGYIQRKNWVSAKEYSKAAADIFPNDSRLWVFLLLADCNCQSIYQLYSSSTPLRSNSYFNKAVIKADKNTEQVLRRAREYQDKGNTIEETKAEIAETKEKIKELESDINICNIDIKNKKTHNDAKSLFHSAQKEKGFKIIITGLVILVIGLLISARPNPSSAMFTMIGIISLISGGAIALKGYTVYKSNLTTEDMVSGLENKKVSLIQRLDYLKRDLDQKEKQIVSMQNERDTIVREMTHRNIHLSNDSSQKILTSVSYNSNDSNNPTVSKNSNVSNDYEYVKELLDDEFNDGY